jgi:hypothetical protein
LRRTDPAVVVEIDRLLEHRSSTDLHDKLFPIIHKCPGIALDRLVYHWSAMNPPTDDDDGSAHRGAKAPAAELADRFAFVVEVRALRR